MARLGRTQRIDVEPALAQLHKLSESPLCAVAAQLRPLLESAAQCYGAGEMPPDMLQAVLNCTSEILSRLPQDFGPRFDFDALQIATTTDTIGRRLFSAMLVPTYDQSWGHERVPMPSERGRPHDVIDLIHIAGQTDLLDVDLLSYPWLGHELGHNLLHRHGAAFFTLFSRALKAHEQKLKLASIADRGLAQAKAARLIEDCLRFWTPTEDHRNWAHEIAADCIALWIFGPAYLACFDDVLDADSLNPYQLTQEHPPYAARADALIYCAQTLGWSQARLERRVGAWNQTEWRSAKDNRLRALADETLVRSAADAALELCRSLELRRCLPKQLDRISATRGRRDPDFGVDLVLEAYVTFEESGEESYLGWQRATLERLAGAITP